MITREKLDAAYERAWELDALGLRTWWSERAFDVLRRLRPATAPLLSAYLRRGMP